MKNPFSIINLGLNQTFMGIFSLAFFANSAFSQSSTCLPLVKSYYEGDSLAYQQINSYNPNGFVSKKSERFLKNNFGSYTQEETYEYDTQNNVSSITRQLNGKFEKKTLRQYDGNNILIKELTSLVESGTPVVTFISEKGEITNFGADGQSGIKTTRTTDSEGRLLSEIILGSDEKPMISLQNEYNAAGKLSIKTRQDLAANNTRKTNYKYDTKGNLIDEVITINNELFMRDVSEYDSKNNLIKKTTYNRYGNVDYVLTYAYTADNLLSEESYFYNNELITKKTIAYDTKGNAVRRETFERGKLVNHTTITYDCK